MSNGISRLGDGGLRLPNPFVCNMRFGAHTAPLQFFRSSEAVATKSPRRRVWHSRNHSTLPAKLNPTALFPAQFKSALNFAAFRFEDGTGWGEVPVLATAPSGSSQRNTPQLPQRIRVGKNIQEANLLQRVPPIYPLLAKQARIQGLVVLEVTISRIGDVAGVRAISGHPLLIEAALDAVRQWKYRRTLLNDQPVEVVSSVEVQFTSGSEQ